MAVKLSVDLHKLSKFVNTILPVVAILFFLAGWKLSFYFHFGTMTFVILTMVNVFYRHIQKGHTLLRNFGIMGQARYIMESIGPELRQYFFASDTEEKPFNRNERSEVYRKAQGIDSASSFGSQNQFDSGEIKIRHSMYPINKDTIAPYSLTLGDERGIEKAYTLTRPFIISAMSYGALGQRAVRSFARGAQRASIPMNTGEGGYPKYHLMEGCDLIFQMGTAKFGVRNDDGTLNDEKLKELVSKPEIKAIEIKLSQGAKPGKGGLLPKEKITDEIAELRGVPKDCDVISPSFHPECIGPQNTVAFVKRVQELTELPVGIKLCLGRPAQFEELVQEMKEQGINPDWITVDGSEGGTGAAPKAFIDSVGIPLFPALKIVGDILKKHGIRDQLKLLASGKLVSPEKQMIAFSLGADAIYTARGFMLAIGCIQALQCGNNTCPIGITTHDPELQHGIDIAAKSTRVLNYVNALEHDLEELLASTGAHSVGELNYENLFVPAGTHLHQIATEGRL